MSLTLAQFEVRVSALLYDATHTPFTLATVDEGLRLALHDYSDVNPLAMDAVITLPAAGREIALNSLTDLRKVHEVWWPYDSVGAEVWPPNRVDGFRLFWDDAQPVLFLNAEDGGQPQSGDEVRVFYSKPHVIQNLDGGDVTTVLSDHESILELGAAGYACFARSIDVSETWGVAAVSTPNLASVGLSLLREYRRQLEWLRLSGSNPAGVSGAPPSSGWRLDAWDGDN